MSDGQIFQLIGVIYLAVGIGIILFPEFYNKVMAGFMDNPTTQYMGGMFAMIAGFLLVRFHNVWVKDWPVIITIIGWIALVKGTLLIVLPKPFMEMSRKFLSTTSMLTIWAIVAIILGLLCCWLGFFVMPKFVYSI